MNMGIRLLIVYLLNIFDLAATWYWVSKYGIEFELNPVGRILLSSSPTAVIIKVGLVGICLFYIYGYKENKLAKIVSWLLLFFFVILTIYHVVSSIIIIQTLQQIQIL